MFRNARSQCDIATIEIVLIAYGVAGVHADPHADGTIGVSAEIGIDRSLNRESAMRRGVRSTRRS